MINPVAPPEANPAAPKVYPVVVIDDDADDLFFITRRISKSGTKLPVLKFSDSMEAVRYFTRVCEQPEAYPAPCLVFCDIKMPRLNGFDVLRWFRAQKALQEIDFVVLSGSNEVSDREKAAALGATSYLVKYPAENVFAEVIRKAEAQARATRRD